MITRRSFVKAAALGALSGSTFAFPAKSFAAEDEFPSTEIEFTEEIAASMGLNFAKSMNLGEGVAVGGATFLYDTSLRPFGYEVSFSNEEGQVGYVVFDTRLDGLVGEYAVGENVAEHAALALARSATGDKLVQISPLSYGYLDEGTKTVRDEEGRLHDVLTDSQDIARTKIDSLMFDLSNLYSRYSVLDMNTVQQFSAFDSAMLIGFDSSGRYACGVASAFAVCDNYGAVRGASLQSDFRAVWNLVGPKKATGGWSSTVAQAASAVRQFCAQRGKTILTETMATKPAFSKIKTYVNSNNLCSLGLSTDESDHMVTVEGWAEVSQGGARSAAVPMLIIYDGWNSFARCVNYNYGYEAVNGAFYNGR